MVLKYQQSQQADRVYQIMLYQAHVKNTTNSCMLLRKKKKNFTNKKCAESSRAWPCTKYAHAE